MMWLTRFKWKLTLSQEDVHGQEAGKEVHPGDQGVRSWRGRALLCRHHTGSENSLDWGRCDSLNCDLEFGREHRQWQLHRELERRQQVLGEVRPLPQGEGVRRGRPRRPGLLEPDRDQQAEAGTNRVRDIQQSRDAGQCRLSQATDWPSYHKTPGKLEKTKSALFEIFYYE